MTTTSIETDKAAPQPAKPAKPTPQPRAVSVTHGEPHDGRLPVTVTVVPVEDLDAKGGVFVDFKKGTKIAESDNSLSGDGGARSPSAIQQGDDAVAALAAKEIATAAHPPLPPAPNAPLSAASAAPIEVDDVTKVMAAVDADGRPPRAKEAIVSQQIAQGLSLTVGQAETFRADVGFPGGADGETWFVRGRFATIGGKDLSSGWLKI